MECLINGLVPTELMINGKVISGCAKGGNVVYRKKNADFATNYGDDIITTNDTVYAQIKNLNIYGKSTIEDDVISSVGDSGNIEVSSCGRNLTDSLTTTLQNSAIMYISYPILPSNRYYTQSNVYYTGTTWGHSQLWENNNNIVSAFDENVNPIALTATADTENQNFLIAITGFKEKKYMFSRVPTINGNLSFQSIMLELGQEAHDYEPYQGQTKTLTLTEPLRGVPTTSTTYANYTDSDGQMWISDYIDVEEGLRYYNCTTGRLIECYELSSEDDTYMVLNTPAWAGGIIECSPSASSNFVSMISNFQKEDDEILISSSGSLMLKIKKSRLITADLDGVNQWLEENPTYLCGAYVVYSARPSPVAIDTTSLKKLRSYASQTNLFISDNAGLQADFRVTQFDTTDYSAELEMLGVNASNTAEQQINQLAELGVTI